MKTVFFDVDTQNDFMLPAGALYVPGAERILPAIVRLNQFAIEHRIPLISTTDAHPENDPEFRVWPPHCVQGTFGQKKPAETDVGQIVLTKQTLDCFTIPDLLPLLQQMDADRFVVYGVVTEVCVRFAWLGLIRTGKPVEVVTDAIRELDAKIGAETLAQFVEQGGTLTTVDRVIHTLSA